MNDQNTIKIEKNVPIPSMRQGRKSMYPIGKLKEGDSFFVPSDGSLKGYTQRNSVYVIARRLGVKVTIANEDGGFRVWRVS